jgi:uncharacterized protein involved in exopolysaccharide biosynthesis
MATDGRQRSTVKSVHDLGLVEALRALRPQLWLVLGIAAAVGGVAFVLSLLQDDEYTASATVLSRNQASVVLVRGPKHYRTGLIAPRPDAGREVVSSARLASLDAVTDRAAERLGRGLSGEELRGMVDVKPILESDLLEFQATAARPRLAAEFANAFAREYVEFRHEQDRSKIRRATRMVKRELRGIPASRLKPAGVRSRRQQLETLNIVASLQTGNLGVVDRAKPPSGRSSPHPARNALVGLALGLLLGVTVGLIRARIGARSRSEPTVPGPMVDRVASGGHR